MVPELECWWENQGLIITPKVQGGFGEHFGVHSVSFAFFNACKEDAVERAHFMNKLRDFRTGGVLERATAEARWERAPYVVFNGVVRGFDNIII